MKNGNGIKEVQLTVRVTGRINERLKRVAPLTDLKIAEFVRLAIIEKLTREERRNG